MNDQPEQKLPEVPPIQPVAQPQPSVQVQPSNTASSPSIEPSPQVSYRAPENVSGTAAPAEESPAVDGVLEWSAPEYIQKSKSTIWFAGLGVVALILVLVDIFFMRVYTFSALVVVMSVAVVVWSRRPARTVYYRLDESAIVINEKRFPFRDFRSFGVVQEDGFYSITMVPSKRFLPSVNIYFPEDLGEYIVDTLGVFLPMEKIKLDFIDNLMRRLNL